MSGSNQRRLQILEEAWRDVQLVQDPPANEVVAAIQHDAYDKQLLRVFRSVCLTEERSWRVYELTTEVLTMLGKCTRELTP
jgi:hypothetical protein